MTYVLTYIHIDMICFTRSYKELVPCLIEEGDEFVDSDWEVLAQIKTVEPVAEYTAGWRPVTLYRLCDDHDRVCLHFGGDQYEGLDANRPYSFVDGVLFDSDGDRIELFEPLVKHVDLTCVNELDVDECTILDDPELKELEEGGGGYLSNDDDDGDGEFMIDGEGDKNIIKM